ncbi:uncharacterized protein LOC129543293, partial [Moschus berezovskii]|uniref:uncharacterized protein LOC129543293 n=1 Tax=Moschus berezovskii TaxID=68408 RepID=UPI002444241B
LKEKPTAWKTGETEDYSQDTSYLEELEKHKFSVCCSSAAANTASGEFFKHLCFVLMSVFSELEFAQWQSQGFWYIILLMASLWFLRLYLHYLSQWFFLQAISTPVTKFRFSPLTVELCYPASSLHIAEEMLVVAVGPFMLNAMVLPLVLIRWGCQLLFAFCPDVLSKLIITMGLWAVLDPLAVFIVDTVLGRFTESGETPVADAAKLYWMFERTMQSGILGVMLTVLLYVLLFIISSLILYVYCLRLNNDSWILDTFQRIHSEENKFFIPYDLEISNQELSYIVKRSEQWRGLNGERRKVAVYDYICKKHGVQSSISSGDLQQHNDISVAALGPGGITAHVAVYTVYPSGFQELYRHFLRLPSGAIVESQNSNFQACWNLRPPLASRVVLNHEDRKRVIPHYLMQLRVEEESSDTYHIRFSGLAGMKHPQWHNAVAKNLQHEGLSIPITLALWSLARAVSVMALMKVCLPKSPFEYNLEEISNCLELSLAD